MFFDTFLTPTPTLPSTPTFPTPPSSPAPEAFHGVKKRATFKRRKRGPCHPHCKNVMHPVCGPCFRRSRGEGERRRKRGCCMPVGPPLHPSTHPPTHTHTYIQMQCSKIKTNLLVKLQLIVEAMGKGMGCCLFLRGNGRI